MKPLLAIIAILVIAMIAFAQINTGGGGGGSGTVNAGTTGQLAVYPSNGTAVQGDTLAVDDGTHLTYTGTGGVILPNGGVSTPTISWANSATYGFYSNSATVIAMESAGANKFAFGNGSVLRETSTGQYAWSGSGDATASSDTSVCRQAAGVAEIGSGSACATTGKVKASGYMSVGTTFTGNNGCTETTLTGGATAGKFTAAGQTSCTIVITMGDTATAPNGWSCTAIDLTTSADVTNPHQTASTATTATFATGTIVAGDVIQFSCVGY